MASVTCGGGQSTLPVPGGCAAAGIGCGGAGSGGELQARLVEVPGVAMELWSCSEACSVHWNWGLIFWMQSGISGSSGGLWLSRLLVDAPLRWWRSGEYG